MAAWAMSVFLFKVDPPFGNATHRSRLLERQMATTTSSPADPELEKLRLQRELAELQYKREKEEREAKERDAERAHRLDIEREDRKAREAMFMANAAAPSQPVIINNNNNNNNHLVLHHWLAPWRVRHAPLLP